MILVIAEKAIAGQRIATILAGKQIVSKSYDRVQFFDFEENEKRYRVIPLRGHIMDVEFPKEYSYWVGTDLKKLVMSPVEYVETEKGIISLLKKNAPEMEQVIIATDADREGESIGVESLRCLLEKNPNIKVKRAYFSAITPEEIKTAFSKLGKVDYNFADSADARREIDLIWGAVLTRFLSLVSGKLGKEFLSMGRVQGPTLALIVNREKERMAFESKKYWEVKAVFEKDKKSFEALHKRGRFWKKDEAMAVLEKRTDKCVVSSVKKVRKTIAKPIPFNTTSFLRAATAIGFTAGRAMQVAETLYMRGFISYPRTDNTVYPTTLNLKEILNKLIAVPEFASIVEKIFSLKKLLPSKGKRATKDHPPIHPVAAAKKQELSEQEWKIYELVCRRFFATLAEDAETENISVEILMKDEPFVAHGLVVLRLGWKEFYPYSKTVEVFLPSLKKADLVDLKELDVLEKKTLPPARYSQGSLIKLMADLNLGTKATRHEIIQKLYARRYISGYKAIEPNKIAFAVVDCLEKYGKKVVEPTMTAELEKEMDAIASGKKEKKEVVDESREFLQDILNDLLKNKNNIGSSLRQALIADSVVADCTQAGCDGKLMIRTGRTGKRFLGCSNYPKCTTSYPLPQKGKIVVLDKNCEVCGKPMLKVVGKRYSFSMCIALDCPSKSEWKKKPVGREEK